MEKLFFCFFFMFIVGLISFSLKHKHLLLMLLSLEFMVLSLFGLIMIILFDHLNGNFINLVFLTFSVCEGVMGLSILISLIRTHGNDYFQSFNILW